MVSRSSQYESIHLGGESHYCESIHLGGERHCERIHLGGERYCESIHPGGERRYESIHPGGERNYQSVHLGGRGGARVFSGWRDEPLSVKQGQGVEITGFWSRGYASFPVLLCNSPTIVSFALTALRQTTW